MATDQSIFATLNPCASGYLVIAGVIIIVGPAWTEVDVTSLGKLTVNNTQLLSLIIVNGVVVMEVVVVIVVQLIIVVLLVEELIIIVVDVVGVVSSQDISFGKAFVHFQSA